MKARERPTNSNQHSYVATHRLEAIIHCSLIPRPYLSALLCGEGLGMRLVTLPHRKMVSGVTSLGATDSHSIQSLCVFLYVKQSNVWLLKLLVV